MRTSQKFTLEHNSGCLKITKICDLLKLRKRYKTCVKSKILAPRRLSGCRFYWFCVGFINKLEKLKIPTWGLDRGLAAERVYEAFIFVTGPERNAKFQWFWSQNDPKMRPEFFRKSLRFQGLSPGGHFCPPWPVLGSIFARLGTLSGFIMVAGDWGCCFCSILLDRVYFWPSVVIVTAISAPF